MNAYEALNERMAQFAEKLGVTELVVHIGIENFDGILVPTEDRNDPHAFDAIAYDQVVVWQGTVPVPYIAGTKDVAGIVVATFQTSPGEPWDSDDVWVEESFRTTSVDEALRFVAGSLVAKMF